MSVIREILSLGTSANDGTGDKLRSMGGKINRNFEKIWLMLGGDSDEMTSSVYFGDSAVVFEGSIVNDFETRLVATNPTADRIINLPNTSGEVVLNIATQTLTNKTIDTPTLVTPRMFNVDQTFRYNFLGSAIVSNRNVTLPLLTTNDTFTFNNHTQTLTNKTLTAPTINSPSIGTAINDVNAAALVSLTATGSAVNNLSIANAATGNSPLIASIGADSDISLDISAKNGGSVRITKLALRSTTVTANGGVPKNFSHIDCNKGTLLALTLANGTTSGEQKVFTNRGAGNVTVTVTSFANGSTFTLAQNEACTLTWDGLRWYITGGYSILTIT